MLDFIYHTYIHYLQLPFISLVKQLESKPAGIYVLIAILIVVSTAQSKIMKRNQLKALLSSTAVATDGQS